MTELDAPVTTTEDRQLTDQQPERPFQFDGTAGSYVPVAMALAFLGMLTFGLAAPFAEAAKGAAERAKDAASERRARRDQPDPE